MCQKNVDPFITITKMSVEQAYACPYSYELVFFHLYEEGDSSSAQYWDSPKQQRRFGDQHIFADSGTSMHAIRADQAPSVVHRDITQFMNRWITQTQHWLVAYVSQSSDDGTVDKQGRYVYYKDEWKFVDDINILDLPVVPTNEFNVYVYAEEVKQKHQELPCAHSLQLGNNVPKKACKFCACDLKRCIELAYKKTNHTGLGCDAIFRWNYDTQTGYEAEYPEIIKLMNLFVKQQYTDMEVTVCITMDHAPTNTYSVSCVYQHHDGQWWYIRSTKRMIDATKQNEESKYSSCNCNILQFPTLSQPRNNTNKK